MAVTEEGTAALADVQMEIGGEPNLLVAMARGEQKECSKCHRSASCAYDRETHVVGDAIGPNRRRRRRPERCQRAGERGGARGCELRASR